MGFSVLTLASFELKSEWLLDKVLTWKLLFYQAVSDFLSAQSGLSTSTDIKTDFYSNDVEIWDKWLEAIVQIDYGKTLIRILSRKRLLVKTADVLSPATLTFTLSKWLSATLDLSKNTIFLDFVIFVALKIRHLSFWYVGRP